MSERLAVDVDVFAEDRAQEVFVDALLRRIAREEQVALSVQIRSAKGGGPRALSEFGAYQALLEKGVFRGGVPDLVVVVIDGNCATPTRKRQEIEAATRPGLINRVVAGCPNPHVERWFLGDPDSFHEVVGHRPVVGPEKCEREHYKHLLREAIRQGQDVAPLDGVEFAPELVEAMDLYRAGKLDPSLRSFVEGVRSKVRQIRASRSLEARSGD